MCFIFVKQLNVIFTQQIYEAVILCDCIIKFHLDTYDIYE